jgi:DNA-binding Xre family transcriptional regulator
VPRKPRPSKTIWRTHWHLRMLAAERGYMTAKSLFDALQPGGLDITESQLRRIFTGQPERLSLALLAQLCCLLKATPGDLLTVVKVPARATLTAVPTDEASRQRNCKEQAAAMAALVGPPVPALPKGRFNA